jgi:hypothetical protein
MWREKTLLVFAIYIAIAVTPVSAFTVDGDKVSIDDANVYMTQEPHTLHSSGWVTNTLTSKQFTGDMDVYFGFDSQAALPLKAELYSPHEVNETKSYTCDSPYWYNYTGTHFWCWQDITTTTTDNQTGENTTVTATYHIFDHDYETSDLGADTFSWTETHTEDYVNVADVFTKVNYDHNGKDTWYYATNVPVQAGTEYSLRTYIKTQFNTAGKYDWCVKPSSETLSEAVTNGHLYCLDPWWNASFGYRYEIQNSSTLHEKVPFAVNDTAGINGTMIWTRYGAGCTGTMYVYSELPSFGGDLAIGNATDECYWEDTATLTGNNATGVYPDHALMLHHDYSTGFSDSSQYGNDATGDAYQNATGGLYDKVMTTDPTNDINYDVALDSSLQIASTLTVQLWIYPNNTYTDKRIIEHNVNDWSILHTDGGGGVKIYVNGGKVCDLPGGQFIPQDQWSLLTMVYNDANNSITTFLDDTVHQAGCGYSSGAITYSSDLNIGSEHGTQNFFPGHFDNVQVIDKVYTFAEVQQAYWNGVDNLTTLGAEEIGNMPPTVDLASPANSSSTSDTTPDFQFYVNNSEAEDTLMAGLFIDNVNCGANHSVTNGTLTTITSTCNLSKGAHEWAIIANDTQTAVYPALNWTLNVYIPTNYNKTFNIPLGVSKIIAGVHWYSTSSGGANITINNGTNTYSEFQIPTFVREFESIDISLPFIEYNITIYSGYKELTVNNPTSGNWELKALHENVTRIETDVRWT